MIKKLVTVLLLASFLLAGCLFNDQAPDEVKTKVPLGFHSEVDFEDSIFKHISNDGIIDDETLPYNIDAITGATTTVEGPAIVTSIPLSVREMENPTEGFYRADEAAIRSISFGNNQGLWGDSNPNYYIPEYTEEYMDEHFVQPLVKMTKQEIDAWPGYGHHLEQLDIDAISGSSVSTANSTSMLQELFKYHAQKYYE